MSRKSTAQHNQAPAISYHDALRLRIDGVSVAAMRDDAFLNWVLQRADGLPYNIRAKLHQVEPCWLPDRWQALCILIENGVQLPTSKEI